MKGLTKERKRDILNGTGENFFSPSKSLLNMPAKGERLQAIIEYLPKRDQRPERGQRPQVYQNDARTRGQPQRHLLVGLLCLSTAADKLKVSGAAYRNIEKLCVMLPRIFYNHAGRRWVLDATGCIYKRMRRKTKHPRQTRQAPQRKGEKLLTQLSELQALFTALDPQPAAGEEILSFRRRSA